MSLKHNPLCQCQSCLGNHSSLAVDSACPGKPKAGLYPDTFSFGSVVAGAASVSQVAVLKNEGNADLLLKDIVITGPFTYSIDMAEGGTLLPGSQANITITFKPVDNGIVSGSIYLDTNSVGGNEFILLSGEGIGSGSSMDGYSAWPYNDGSALGGERDIIVPDLTSNIPFAYLNGFFQFAGYSYTFDPATHTVHLASPLELGDTLIFMLSGDFNDNTVLLDSAAGRVAREALRRTYAEAGYNLVEGSFDTGGTVNTATDVLLNEVDGKAYSWGGVKPKIVVASSTPESSGEIGSDKWMAVDVAALRTDLTKLSGPKLIGGLPFDSMYGDLSTSSDNTAALNERLNWSQTTGKTVELPAGRFPVAGELELGGVKVRGRSIGFRNSDGTVLVGSGQDRMFNQSVSTFPYFAATKLESLRIENVICGLEFGYLNRAEFEDVHIDSTGTSIRFGRAVNSGPQWNIMRRCTALSNGGSALYMNGAAWCNNNTFELCFFESRQNGLTPAVVIDCAGGYGAIGNLFLGTEISSEGYGIRLINARATGLIGAYMECHGPAILLRGTSYGTKVSGGVFARQRNNNGTGVNWAIYHESGNASIEIDKPYVVIATPADQDGCGFIGYAGSSPAASLVVDITSDPVTENIGGVDYTRYQDGLFSKITKITHADHVIQSNASPSISLQYENGTKKVELYSNSTKDGSDFGGVLKVNDITRMQFTADGSKILMPGQKIGLPAEANTNAPGAKTHRIQVLSETGAFLGYLAVYSS